MGFLKLIGAVSAAEHKELRDLLTTVSRERSDALIAAGEADEKFKKAITDLAEQWEKATRLEATVNTADNQTIAALRSRDEWKETATTYAAEIAALRPDAEAMRAKRTRDREQKAYNRNATKSVAAKGRGK